MTAVRRRFWIEAGLGAASAFLLLLTVAVPDWIEVVSGVEPDGGDGSLEWALTAALAACAVAFALVARAEWRRPRAAAAAGDQSGAGS